MINLKFHHTGLLVGNIQEALEHYIRVFGAENVSEIYSVKSQGVNVCFIKNGEASYIELVEPAGENSVVSRMLKNRVSYYHIGYKVEDIHQTITDLETLNYKAMEPFRSEAFDGKLCVFLYTPDAHLIELIEA